MKRCPNCNTVDPDGFEIIEVVGPWTKLYCLVCGAAWKVRESVVKGSAWWERFKSGIGWESA